MTTPVSIIICTRNHLPRLQQTLASVGALAVPQALSPELIVVDNGSQDGTAAWVRQVRLANMPVYCLQEPRVGQVRARNRGLAAAQGDVVLFTDDDVRLPANWLQAMCGPIVSGRADAVRGKSVLDPGLHRPWMQVFHRAVLAVTEGMDEGGRADMVGLSMAFGRHVLALVPAFDPELGPGTTCGFFDDTLFALQVQQAGFRIATVLEAPVEHAPDPDRLARRGYLRAAEGRGRGLAYLAYHWHHEAEEHWTRRRSRWQLWRAPRLVLVKRWLNLWGWRLSHPHVFWQREGVNYREFALVNQLFQIRQYLEDRRGPRNYERRGLAKRHGVRPDATGVAVEKAGHHGWSSTPPAVKA